MKVLIAEDEVRLRSLLERALRESGYSVVSCGNADEAEYALATEAVDLCIVDVMMPGTMNGFELCRQLRARNIAVPILLLTARDGPADRVVGLDAGADDYLTKPFHLPELLARVRALLRRAPVTVAPVLRIGELELDVAARRARVHGRDVDLTVREFGVLELLMRAPGTVVTSSDFIDHVWDAHYEGYSNVVASTIRHVRSRLAEAGATTQIRTVRGQGYVIS